MIIRGNVAGVPAPQANLHQTDAARADYIQGRDIILSHHEDKSNPHGVTLQQLGAAAASHTHTPAEVGAMTESAVTALIQQQLGVIENGTY